MIADVFLLVALCLGVIVIVQDRQKITLRQERNAVMASLDEAKQAALDYQATVATVITKKDQTITDQGQTITQQAQQIATEQQTISQLQQGAIPDELVKVITDAEAGLKAQNPDAFPPPTP